MKTDSDDESEGLEKSNNLKISGMSWDTTEDDIKEYFEHFGEIVRVQLRRRQCSGKSKGFGFIQFADKEVEKKAGWELQPICFMVRGFRFCYNATR